MRQSVGLWIVLANKGPVSPRYFTPATTGAYSDEGLSICVSRSDRFRRGCDDGPNLVDRQRRGNLFYIAPDAEGRLELRGASPDGTGARSVWTLGDRFIGVSLSPNHRWSRPRTAASSRSSAWTTARRRAEVIAALATKHSAPDE
jgi:hypothetical protein